MAQKFKSVVTVTGQARIAAATGGGDKVDIKTMVIGDGNGAITEPSATQTALVHEVHRLELNSLKTSPDNPNWLIAEAVVPASAGGFWMRELGLLASDGSLLVVCNMAETYKPTLAEGSGRTQTLRMVMSVTDTEAVQLLIDDTLIIATEAFVKTLIGEHEKSRNHPDATLTEKGFVALSNDTNSTSETRAATPKAVKVAFDNANTRLAKDQNLADVPDKAQARQALGLGAAALMSNSAADFTALAGSPTEAASTKQLAGLRDRITPVAQGGTGASTAAAALANLGGVPTTRKVNGKALTSDITISLADVGGFPLNPTALTVSLNTLGAAPGAGLYYQPSNAGATVANNYPIQEAGTLLVTISAYGCQQEYTAFSSGRKFLRGLGGHWNGSGPWLPWREYLLTTGNAASATKLQTARTIGGTAFDGSANITPGLATAATKLQTARTIGGTAFDGSANITPGLAAAATRLQTARAIAGVAFDGTANIAIPAGNVGAYTKAEVNSLLGSKGGINTAGAGWWKCGSTGRMIQGVTQGWGNNTTYRTVVFPVAFPNACLGVSVSHAFTSYTSNGNACVVESISRTQFVIRLIGLISGNFSFVAFGY